MITFDELFRKYFPTMLFFANRYLEDKITANDVATDAFLKLYTSRDSFIEIKCRAFLYIAIRNDCLNILKRREYVNKRTKEYFRRCTTTIPSHEHAVLYAEIIRELAQTIETLPTECKKIIKMRYVDDISWRQIAEVLELSPNTVKNQIDRGKGLIKKRFPIQNHDRVW